MGGYRHSMVADAIVADLTTNGPATPTTIARRLGKTDAKEVWRFVLRMANAGQISFDDTGRIASLATPVPTPTSTQEPTR